MRFIIAKLLFFVFLNTLFAQHETDQRVLGYKYFLKFNQGIPDLSVTTPNFFDPNIWHANGEKITHYANSICDTLGNLLFYYDGINVYDKDKHTLENGNIHSRNFSSYYYSTLIVPIEESNRRYYYLFETIPYEEHWNTEQNACGPNVPCPEFLDLCKLQYHVIDMGADGKGGRIISKNNFVMDSVGSTLSGVKHANNIDTWVTVIKFKSNKVYNFKVNYCSIGKPVISVIPDFEYEIQPINYTSVFRFTFGFQIVYSTQGDYISFNGYKLADPPPAQGSIRYTYLHYATFNNTTGFIDISSLKTTGPSSIYNNLYTVGPAVFSHDSKKIYYFSEKSDGFMTQFDLTTNTSIILPGYGSIFQVSPLDYGKNKDLLIFKINPQSSVSSFPSTSPFYFNDYNYFTYSEYWFSLGNINDQIVVNGVGNNGLNSYRSTIFDPICRNNYIYNFYHPDYKKPNFSTPKSIVEPIKSPACYTSPVHLAGHSSLAADSLFWFVKKDGAAQWQKYTADTFDLAVTPGTYKATYVSFKYCLGDSATQQFTVEDYPAVHLADDTIYTCESKPVMLPANTTYSYRWENVHGDVVSNLVTETGQYNMVVQNSCGTAKDSLYVSNSVLNIANLVTVNNDQKNDCWKIQSNNSTEKIHVSIYNSWGSSVFSDNNYQNNWCPMDESDGIYYYDITYNNACAKKGWLQVMH